ncbi:MULTISPECIES: helix-turn-helix domain-containing protein [Enterobacterales]|uniref:helix-turn-helix domain-containing protein n=1 Tax=Enterobacterales TaxID=91347 RepID=UPI002ED98CEC
MNDIFFDSKRPEKPFGSFRRLMLVLRSHAIHRELLGNCIVKTNDNEPSERFIHMIPHGYCTLHRHLDDLQVFSVQPPIILGISSLVHNKEYFYLRTLGPCDCYSLLSDDAIKIINENYMWKDVAKILAFFTELWAARDAVLTGVNAYTSIREHIKEYMEQPALLRYEITTAEFVKQRTGLSRSMILKVISELRKGGYIDVIKGRVTEIYKLPERW